MKINNQLHQRLIQEIKGFYTPSIYPKSEEEMKYFIEKSLTWIVTFYGAWEKPFERWDELELPERITQELQLLKQFEKELDPLILIELAKLNFRYFVEQNYIFMINNLRTLCLIYKIKGATEDDVKLANYAKKIIEKMAKIPIPRFRKGRKPYPFEDIIIAVLHYRYKLKLYWHIKKEIEKFSFPNNEVLKSRLKRKYNVSDDEIEKLILYDKKLRYRPSELANEKTTERMKYSKRWVKEQIKRCRNSKLIKYIEEHGDIELILGCKKPE